MRLAEKLRKQEERLQIAQGTTHGQLMNPMHGQSPAPLFPGALQPDMGEVGYICWYMDVVCNL